MTAPTFATLFSGGGIADVGIRAAGYRHLWGVEYDDSIAAVARLNGFEVITADVLDVDPGTLEAPYYLHASPVCTRASQANQTAEENENGTKEAQLDLDMAAKVCEFLEVMKPPAFTLENVYGYRKFKAFAMITDTLSRLGYMWDYQNLNSADFGVPQTRRRLILRARLGALLPQLPAPVEWVGWYAAIEDLIPTLPDSKFAPWQLERMPKEFSLGFIMSTLTADGTSPPRKQSEPSLTVVSSAYKNMPRAFIVDGTGNDRCTTVTVKDQAEPIYTITASVNHRPQRAGLENGRVVKMTARALARFQSIPDSYILPDKESLATRIIGNGYPSLMAQRIAEGFLP